jgi:hypothetical protein
MDPRDHNVLNMKISYEVTIPNTCDLKNVEINDILCKETREYIYKAEIDCFKSKTTSLPYFPALETLRCDCCYDIKRMYYYSKLVTLHCWRTPIFRRMNAVLTYQGTYDPAGLYHSCVKRLIVLTQWLKKLNSARTQT